MYVYRNINWKIIFSFAWKRMLIYSGYGALVILTHHEFSHHEIDISIPYSPIGTIGIAVAFYVGFKNNQSYDRFWEARKIWGGIVNYSRTWGNQVMSLIQEQDMSEEELAQTKKT